MPRADTRGAFVWRSSIGPSRSRLAGALAIAVSCGSLGVLAGRWSMQVGTAAEPGTRTAALIAAVTEETRGKAASPASKPHGSAPAAPPSRQVVAPETGPSAVATARANSGFTNSPQRDPPARSAAEAPTPLQRLRVEHPRLEHPQLAGKAVGAAAAPPTPAGGVTATPSAAAMGDLLRPDAPPSSTPTAPNYQALRDYALSR
jgi:hypothetical protein